MIFFPPSFAFEKLDLIECIVLEPYKITLRSDQVARSAAKVKLVHPCHSLLWQAGKTFKTGAAQNFEPPIHQSSNAWYFIYLHLPKPGNTPTAMRPTSVLLAVLLGASSTTIIDAASFSQPSMRSSSSLCPVGLHRIPYYGRLATTLPNSKVPVRPRRKRTSKKATAKRAVNDKKRPHEE